MAIRFACAHCGKYHRIADHDAGRAGRCGRCGHRFIAPGNPAPASSPIFVPAAAPNLDTPPPSSNWGAFRAIGLGLLVAACAVGLIFQFRDRLVAANPALAPMLPPAAAPAPLPVAPPAATDPVAVGAVAFSVSAAMVVSFLMLLGFFVLVVVLPIVIPPLISRRRYLSAGRWLILAGCSFFIAALFGTCVTILFFPFGLLLSIFSPFVWGVVGCLIAAAVHPKRTVL